MQIYKYCQLKVMGQTTHLHCTVRDLGDRTVKDDNDDDHNHNSLNYNHFNKVHNDFVVDKTADDDHVDGDKNVGQTICTTLDLGNQNVKAFWSLLHFSYSTEISFKIEKPFPFNFGSSIFP